MPEQIDLYADAALLMACLGSALYCLRLNTELKKLRKLDGGVGLSIRELKAATEAVREGFGDVREQVLRDIEELDHRCVTLKSKRQEIDDLLDAMEGQTRHQVRKCREAQELSERALVPLLNKAEVEIRTLTQAVEVASRMTARPAPSYERPAASYDKPAPTAPEPLGKRRGEYGHAAGAAGNPFLRAANG